MESPSLVAKAVLALGIVLLIPGCGSPGADTLNRIAGRWFSALHARDYQKLALVDATAPPERDGEAFAAWVRGIEEILQRYERERDGGTFHIDEVGYALVRAAMLGKGTFYEAVGVSGSAETPVLHLRLTFGYSEIPLHTFPRGTTVYMLGNPLGVIHPITIGRDSRRGLEVLDHIELLVLFAHGEENTVEGDLPYKVERIAWLPDSAVYHEVTWEFD